MSVAQESDMIARTMSDKKNVLGQTLELAKSKYADNATISAIVRCIELSQMEAELCFGGPNVDLIDGYRRGAQGAYGGALMTIMPEFAITNMMVKMAALKKVANQFEVLVTVLQNLGENIDY